MNIKMTEKLVLLIYGCWYVSGIQGREDWFPGPTVFAHALKDVLDKEIFPEWARQEFHFVDASSDLVCTEFPDIEQHAASLGITDGYNFSDGSCFVKEKERINVVHDLQKIADFPQEKAIEWGILFRRAVLKAKKDFQLSPAHDRAFQ